MNRRILPLLSALSVLAGCAPEPGGDPTGELEQAIGEPKSGFPSPEERLGIMAINRARSDPATVRGPQSQMYPARPPVMWSYDFSRSSRFHAINLAMTRVSLMHDSPCPLNPNVAVANCDGNPQCACASPVGAKCANCANVAPVNNGCGTPTFTRIGYFAQNASGEVAAAGTQSTMETVDLWMDEAAGADGHRRNLLDQGTSSTVMGFGHTAVAGCFQTFDVSDSGNQAVTVPEIPTAAISPARGPANGPFRIYATWVDPVGGVPANLWAVVDGVCRPMARELGDPKLNSTFMVDASLGAGCHTYWILGRDAHNGRVTYPTTGALTVDAGGAACNGDFLAQAPAADCEGMQATPDMAKGARGDMAVRRDMAARSGRDLAATGDAAAGGDDGGDGQLWQDGGGGCGCQLGARKGRGGGALALLLAIAIAVGERRRRRAAIPRRRR